MTEDQNLKTDYARNANGTVIEVEDLHKDYGDIAAVDGITFSVNPGETYGLLGPNGAGKTTTMRLLSGLSPATSGSIAVAGIDVIKDNRAVRELMGVVTQHDGLDGGLTVFQNLFLYGFLAGLSRARAKERAHEVLEFFSLRDRSKANVYELSGGMKRRVLIAKALSHEPQILFLDEPTAGVDVELRQDMWHVVRGLRESGVTIILTTHYIEEAEQIADRIGIINHGEIILVQEKVRLMRELGSKQLVLELQEQLRELPPQLDSYDLDVAKEGMELTYTYDSQAEHTGITALLGDLSAAGIKFHDVKTTQSSLEEIFVELVNKIR